MDEGQRQGGGGEEGKQELRRKTGKESESEGERKQ